MKIVLSGVKNNKQNSKQEQSAAQRVYLPVELEQKCVKSDTNHEELMHWHGDVELIRIRKGRVHCHVNDSDFLLRTGELCFINFDTMHRVYNTEKTEGALDVLSIKTDLLAQNKDIYERYVAPVIHNKDFAHVQLDGRNSHAKFITDMFDEMELLLKEKPVGYELDIIGYVYMLFRRLYLVYVAQGELPVAYNSDISLQRRMSSYIYEHYSEKITLDDIARAGGVSRSKCASLFHKFTRKTPIAFLNSYRLEMGSNLLASTDEAISYIANACGFGEQSYFNRLFMKEFGCTPLEWRRTQKAALQG